MGRRGVIRVGIQQGGIGGGRSCVERGRVGSEGGHPPRAPEVNRPHYDSLAQRQGWKRRWRYCGGDDRCCVGL